MQKLSIKNYKLLVLHAVLLGLLAGPVFPVRVHAAAADQEYIVRLKDASFEQHLLRLDSGARKRFTFAKDNEFQNVYTFHSTYTLADLQKALAGEYDYLEVDREFKSTTVTTNDRGFTENPQDIDKEWGLAKAGFADAWEKTTGSTRNIVAVIDTGIDATHEDLSFVNYARGFDFTTNQPIDPYTNSDDNGHGTLIAGVLAGTPNNGRGIVGTNWFITLMPIKALDSAGTGDASTVAEAIVWAADSGASILNMSLGGVGFSHDTTLANAIAYAFNKDVVIVAAAGNDVASTGGNLDDNPVFPICDDNDQNMVIGVAAVDQNDIKPEFSNYGKACVDVVAPGKRILSTINRDPFTNKPAPDSYAYASGTSLAVPFVSGEAALIKTLYPYATNTQIRDRIIASAEPVDQLNLVQCGGRSCASMLGAGRINVVKAIGTKISDTSVREGDLVKISADGVDKVYYITGGRKRLVSPFVLNQRFTGQTPRAVPENALKNFPEGPYTTPLDGTLVKINNDQTVYIISKGVRQGITYQVFLQRGFKFPDIKTVSYPELTSWVTGSLLPPLDGTLVKAARNKTVYWVVGETLHPINYNFFVDKGLNIFPITVFSDDDIANFPKGEAYIK